MTDPSRKAEFSALPVGRRSRRPPREGSSSPSARVAPSAISRFHAKVVRRTWQVAGCKWHMARWFQSKITRATRFTRWHHGRMTVLLLPYVLGNLVRIIYLSLGGTKWRALEQNVRQTCSNTPALSVQGAWGYVWVTLSWNYCTSVPALIPGTPVFVGQKKWQLYVCLHSRTIYDLNGMEHEITLIQISKQALKQYPKNICIFFSHRQNILITMEVPSMVIKIFWWFSLQLVKSEGNL